MVWFGRDLKDYFVPPPLPWARAPSTRSGCSSGYSQPQRNKTELNISRRQITEDIFSPQTSQAKVLLHKVSQILSSFSVILTNELASAYGYPFWSPLMLHNLSK